MIETIERKGNWGPTYKGKQLFYTDPRPEDFCIADIAHALSHLCRFCGHTKVLYTVAQHSVLVSRACAPDDALWGLLHDAPEAYIGDLPAPLKHTNALDGYNEVEECLLQAIGERFGLSKTCAYSIPTPTTPIELWAWVVPESVKQADLALLFAERRDLMTQTPFWTVATVEPWPEKIEPWTPARAKREFLQRFFDLAVAGNKTIKQVARA